ncbi:MAG: hypothetical protein AAGL96_02650 [Pseudomonadota bacterium]
MMNNNKILTVSYGTFSCTLEGFDDSFGTMKAIAEYFRDLAADDRYFGAEPPQPDAEMLARIAEREISRRVEAREQEGRIVLSADPTPAPVMPVTAAVTAKEVTPEVTEEATAAPADATDATDTAEVDLDAVAAATAEPTPEDTAQETVDDPAPDADVADDTTAEIAAPADALTVAAEGADDATTADIVEHVAADADADDIGADETTAPTAFDDVAPDADALTSFDAAPIIVPEDDTVALGSVTDAAAPTSIAAKLQRIRAVVSASQEEAHDEPLFEDEHADAFPPETDVADVTADVTDAEAPHAADTEAPDADDAVLDSLVADINAASAEEDASEEEAAEIDAQEDEIAAALARFDTQMADDTPAADDAVADTELADPIAAEDSTEEDGETAIDLVSADAATDTADTADTADSAEDDDDFAATLARLDAHRADDDADADTDAEGHADTPDDAIGEDSLAADLDRDEVTGETDDSAENLFDDSADTDADALVETDDDADADALTDAAATETVDETVDESVDAAATATADATDTEEPHDAPEQDDTPRRARVIKVKRADIEAALAAGQLEEIEDDSAPASSLSPEDEAELQAELDAVTAELPAVADAPETPADAPDAPVAASEDPASPPVADADVSRLMAEADNQMEEPEGSRRRNAFQHLKAAVMAKKADAGLGRKSADEEGAFRSDLADVVVPRRPSAEGAPRAERPDRPRAAPLKLVAEQRVDTDRPAPTPVQPRRVTQEEITPDADASGNFADYAADMGAHSLPELLEAAASYLSFVEGRAQFSRPQLMNKVRQMQPEDFSREDGLRSFGQLLRAGKITKQQGGRFTVTDDIGYRPDERAAG